MIFLKILFAVILFLSFLLIVPIKVFFNKEGENKRLRIKYLFLSFNPLKEKPKNKNKKKKASKQKNKSKSQNKKLSKKPKKDKKDQKDKKELFQIALCAVKSGGKVFNKLLKSVKIYDVEVFLLVSGDDAFETAKDYASSQALVHSLYGLVCQVFNIDFKKIIISPDFVSGTKEASKLDLSLKAKIPPWRAILIGLIFLFNFLKLTSQKQMQNSSSEKDETNNKKSA